jgi:hypothetical protein
MFWLPPRDSNPEMLIQSRGKHLFWCIPERSMLLTKRSKSLVWSGFPSIHEFG